MEIGILILAILVWAWWFDRYRRRPRRGPGAIDDTALQRDKSRPDAWHGPGSHDGYMGGGGGV